MEPLAWVGISCAGRFVAWGWTAVTNCTTARFYDFFTLEVTLSRWLEIGVKSRVIIHCHDEGFSKIGALGFIIIQNRANIFISRLCGRGYVTKTTLFGGRVTALSTPLD